MNPTAETLDIESPAPGVLVVRLNRPSRLNAVNEAMRDEITAALANIGADAAVKAVVITGAGRGFCSGIDMRDFGRGCSTPMIRRSIGCASRRPWPAWRTRYTPCRSR
jgi:enoyl-CoA hydratase/carnithine racemase